MRPETWSCAGKVARCAIAAVAISGAPLSCSRDGDDRARGAAGVAPAPGARPAITEAMARRPASTIAHGGGEQEPAAASSAAAPAANRGSPTAATGGPANIPPPTGGEPMVIVVLPESPTGSATTAGRGRRTYHLVVTTDMQTATVAIDGHPATAARVQRVRSDATVDSTRAATPSGSGSFQLTPAASVRGIEARPPMRAPGASRLTPLGRRPIVMNPNGAPILD